MRQLRQAAAPDWAQLLLLSDNLCCALRLLVQGELSLSKTEYTRPAAYLRGGDLKPAPTSAPTHFQSMGS